MVSKQVTEFAVVGAGVAGLTATVELALHGCSVTVYSDSAKSPPASLAAPAVFTPYIGDDPDQFRRWAEYSSQTLSDLAVHEEASGVRMRELREYRYKPAPKMKWLDELMSVKPIRPVPKPFAEATTSTRPHIDMMRYMPWLRSMAERAGVQFVERRVNSFDDLFARGHRVVVNCAGVGAKKLASDLLVKPMHGQIVHVPNDIGLTYSLHDDAAGPSGQVAYIFVFDDRLVLGGTFDAGRDDHATDRQALDAIVDRCRELLRFDGHPRWSELGRSEIRTLAGVRPTRGPAGEFEYTRVEREDLGDDRWLVHCYGHGRCGASFSWATAADVVRLALEDDE